MSDYALMTDRYELTMLDSFVRDGSVNKRATFEVFTRKLQKGRRYGVFAGLGRLLPMIENFRFEGDTLKWIREEGIVSKETYDYLAAFDFTGTIDAYREGEIFFPNSPVLTVTGTLGECVILETLILSVLNHDSAIATTAARMVSSAAGRPIIEMGSRRTHEESAVAASRAAYICGFASTSNLLAGKRYGIPTVGTAAHAFTLAHDTERDAFVSQVSAHGPGTTLLVDTYDIPTGIRTAVEVAGEELGAVRIDSGDLAYEATAARELLDSLGNTNTRVTVTSDLDEFVMKDLQSAPIDGYGVGTKLVSAKPIGFVYKLVAIESADGSMRPVAKKAKDKVSVGGKKTAYRVLDSNGRAIREVYSTDGTEWESVTGSVRALQVTVMGEGVKYAPSLDVLRIMHAGVKAELPDTEQNVWYGEDFGPYLTAENVSA